MKQQTEYAVHTVTSLVAVTCALVFLGSRGPEPSFSIPTNPPSVCPAHQCIYVFASPNCPHSLESVEDYRVLSNLRSEDKHASTKLYFVPGRLDEKAALSDLLTANQISKDGILEAQAMSYGMPLVPAALLWRGGELRGYEFGKMDSEALARFVALVGR